MNDDPAPRPLTATYRLQLHAGFTCHDAVEVVPYLHALGISHVYLSPVLTAVPGSEHGYDVLDHGSINPEIGGREGLERLAAVCHEHDLGLVVDVVPNHMALVAPLWRAAPVWEVLREGHDAPRAHWFDVDRDHLEGRIGLPILGEDLPTVLARGEIVVDTGRPDEGPAAGQPVVRYHEHVLPLRPGSDPRADLATLLDDQHWLLGVWTAAPDLLNYRRFFEVDGLIGVRVEEPDVFDDTHALLLELHHAGVIDGFRIDHPDGLADPGGYLERLRAAVRPGTPIWVEKILEGHERLPDAWPCDGTTGYDANAALSAALVDPTTTDVVTNAWVATGGTEDLAEEVERCKRLAVAELLGPEVNRLHRRAAEALPDHDPQRLRGALEELLVQVHVYRAYLRPGVEVEEALAAPLTEGVARARAARPDLADEIDALHAEMLTPTGAAGRDLCVRFQQTTGPVMAKGIEDTAFYRWHRLVALNEVGADPSVGLEPDGGVELLHEWAAHQAEHWPRGLTTLSTHDTKRSEDVRARILAVAGDWEAWSRLSALGRAAAERHDVDPPTAHLVWQTLVGAGRVSTERLAEYLTKAVREAKEHSTWTAPDEVYEARVLALAEEMVGAATEDGGRQGEMADAIGAAIADNALTIRTLILAQKALQLTLPGVPDTYQSSGLVDLSLVDPDNRRPVDYAERVDRLARLDATGWPADLDDELLWVTSRLLRLRSWLPQAYGPEAGYRPVEAGEHVLGFVRGDVAATLTIRAPRALGARGGLGDTRIPLPADTWVDALTGTAHVVPDQGEAQGTVLAADVFARGPVALLVRAHDLQEGPR